MSEARSQLTHEFRLAAEYRRCGWYVFLGTLLTLCVAAFLRHHGLIRGNAEWMSFAIVSLLLIFSACGLLIVVHRWRLRVDETGLARRRLWCWDLWAWDEFETGRIKRQGDGFLSPERPWWRNSLALCSLDEQGKAFVVEACKYFFQPAEQPPCELPDGEIVLRYQLLCTVTFRTEGVSGHTGRGKFEFGWSEVKEVRLVYFDHWSTELRKMELELPSRTLRIEGLNKVAGPGMSPQGVAQPRVIPQIVEDFLQKYAPREKLVRHALHGPPATLSECEHRRRKLRRELRNVLRWHWAMPAGMLMLTSLALGPKLFGLLLGPAALPNAAWLVLAACLTVATMLSHPLMCWGLLREMRIRHSRALSELDAWERQYLGARADA